VAIAFQEKQREWKRRCRHQIVIGRRYCVQQQAIANQPAIHEDVDRVAIPLLHLRARDEAAQKEGFGRRLLGLAAELRDRLRWRHPRWRKTQFALAYPQIYQIFEDLAAENLVDTLALGRD